ncbi:anti-phage deoxyguanosine triphosphatase [Sphingomonas bacterium]|uniref:anti-phage deoxyguanosine triphosphatase n=1 Tax=Sphingomonas bacterium TaxID=1895847 RepID=UPI001576017F|nr:anti-phage deoxyguanosine triphosphatase [Sphingomonas bacterium]
MSERWEERRSERRRHADDDRTDFEIDYARVIHSGAFRRLQGKTQILSLGDDDFYRTRLTHSMEVAQVAEGVVQRLRAAGLPAASEILPPPALVRSIGLAHDIGHPPFGHGGELALNYCMREAGGFEGNAQTLRILSRLEDFSDRDGADLTRRALLGVLKYPALRAEVADSSLTPTLSDGPSTIAVLDAARCRPAKAVYDADAAVLDWVLAPLTAADRDLLREVDRSRPGHGRTVAKSFDCSIMDAADDIAYGVHDLEDAIALGLVTEPDFRDGVAADACAALVDALALRPLGGVHGHGYDGFVARLFGDASARKGAIGRLVHHLIRGVEVDELTAFSEPMLGWRARLDGAGDVLLRALQSLVVRRVIDSPGVQQLEFKGRRMVVAVFEAVCTDPRRLLPADVWRAYEREGSSLRVVADHLSSFTDAALVRAYDRLFSPRAGSVFDRV